VKILIKQSQNKTLLYQALFIIIVTALFFLGFLFPSERVEPLISGPLCLFKRFTGLPCLFCGFTHSLISSFKLSFKEAFFYNPAGILLFFVFITAVINSFLGLSVKRQVILYLNRPEKFIIILGVVLLLVLTWIFRLRTFPSP